MVHHARKKTCREVAGREAEVNAAKGISSSLTCKFLVGSLVEGDVMAAETGGGGGEEEDGILQRLSEARAVAQEELNRSSPRTISGWRAAEPALLPASTSGPRFRLAAGLLVIGIIVTLFVPRKIRAATEP